MGSATFKERLRKSNTPKIHGVSLSESNMVAVCPPPMVGDHPGATTPHGLFLASVGGCVNLIFEIALEKGHIELLDLESEIIGDYETDEDTGRSQFTAITIKTKITVPEGSNEKRIHKLFDTAKDNCPIGNCLVGSCVKLMTDLEVVYK
ncbi:OsmC family peroxiredoxin [Candidatus Thorarchaeota archaeon]|nr:MAG: OsmC family peroxiredoxin [Candidatus Thorarchaeota archaeon]